MSSRRRFLRLLSGAVAFSPWLASASSKKLKLIIDASQGMSLEERVVDERFWREIKQAYSVSPTLVNLNNGGVSPQPRVVQEAVEHYNRLSNETPSYYMWRILDKGREPLRRKLAALAGCSSETIAINRNASEALETVIFGLRLQKGDEVVVSPYDYPNMANAWKQRAHRDGVVLKKAAINPVSDSDDAILNAFVSQFTSRTKVVHITHLINWSGRILPARAIAEAAHQRGIEVLVDGAHSFAHLEYHIPDLMCDYFGTSLHKWLCAPYGSGLLYVKEDKISKIYPLFAAPEPESEDIRKFENLGTRSFAIEHAIAHAVDFHLMIGSKLKEERLRYLKEYWVDRLSQNPAFELYTPRQANSSCALTLFGLKGQDSHDLASYLFHENHIHTVAITHEALDGIRVTPNVYTLKADLDRFIMAVNRYTGG